MEENEQIYQIIMIIFYIMLSTNDSSLNISVDYSATLPLYRISTSEYLKAFSSN